MSSGPSKSDRQKSEAAGRGAENLAVFSLRLKFYRILERRYRSPAGEIDIIAIRGGMLVFIEVKSRPTLEKAMESVSLRQRQRISRAAEAFLQRRPDLQTLTIRFDVLLIVPKRLPHHIKDAWRDS